MIHAFDYHELDAGIHPPPRRLTAHARTSREKPATSPRDGLFASGQWHMKRQKLSRRPTTRWDELMTVR